MRDGTSERSLVERRQAHPVRGARHLRPARGARRDLGEGLGRGGAPPPASRLSQPARPHLAGPAARRKDRSRCLAGRGRRAAALLAPRALDNAGENRENQRRAAAANLERIRLELVREQRPRRATLPLPLQVADLEAAVGADYERRVRAGDLDGPAGETGCRPIQGRQENGARLFTCLAQQGSSSGVYGDRKLVSGYRFRARVVEGGGAAAWCKENPQPLHADQEEFVVVPLSKACTG